MLSKESYKELLELFPEVEFAFAYGSGAIIQKGYNYSDNLNEKDNPMLVRIFIFTKNYFLFLFLFLFLSGYIYCTLNYLGSCFCSARFP